MNDKVAAAFRVQYYDQDQEQYKIKELEVFVDSIVSLRQMKIEDNELAEQMANMSL